MGGGVGGDAPGVLAAGEPLHAQAVLAESCPEDVVGKASEVTEGGDAEGGEAFFGPGADAPHACDRERIEPGGDVVARHDGEPIGFVEGGCKFREEHVRRDADGGGEAEAFADAVTDGLGDGFGRSEGAHGTGDVKECFIDAEGLNPGGDFFEDGEDIARDGGVEAMSPGDDDEVRAAAPGFRDGLGGMAAERARFVRGGGHDAAWPGSTDDDGAVPEFGTIALFDGGEERVHIDVQDHRGFRCARIGDSGHAVDPGIGEDARAGSSAAEVRIPHARPGGGRHEVVEVTARVRWGGTFLAHGCHCVVFLIRGRISDAVGLTARGRVGVKRDDGCDDT